MMPLSAGMARVSRMRRRERPSVSRDISGWVMPRGNGRASPERHFFLFCFIVRRAATAATWRTRRMSSASQNAT